jgi:hypothetical protein
VIRPANAMPALTKFTGHREDKGQAMLLVPLRTAVARYTKKMYDSQLVRASQGNLGARDPESGLVCITPTDEVGKLHTFWVNNCGQKARTHDTVEGA